MNERAKIRLVEKAGSRTGHASWKEKMCRPGFLCLLLALAALAVFLPVARQGFVNYDDSDYVTENAHILSGLTRANVVWAFTTGHASNWHPVTWLSHMLDCQLFGTRAGAQHLVSVGFHIANALLLLLLLRRITGALWRSALVAALFALHPLHVESVAWVSERKDVLSAFFFMLTLLAYAKHVEQSKVQSPKPKVWYGLALVCFTLGLMSKPMLVTLPFVLLLLDYWPLRRFGVQSPKSKVQSSNAPSSNTQHATRIRHHSTTPPLHHSLCFWRSSRSSPSRSPRAW
jgi:4-amino-4-deoxy-L-arabinose transferase-like glycosyltransferase